MSYIAFDLDALNVAPAVARAAGVAENDVIAGLIRMWAWCFREESDAITAIQVRGHFGSDCSEALVAFGFLAPESGSFRVRGAARYLRVKTAQREAAARTNQRRVTVRQSAQSTDDAPVALPDGTPHGGLTLLHRTPNTEHRTPSTEEIQRPPKEHPLQLVWNAARAPSMPTWTATGKARRKHADARLKERDLATWAEVVKRLAASDFASGRSGKWTATPDWLMSSPDNATKVLEGNYDNRQAATDNRSPVAAESVDWTAVTPGEVQL